MNAIKIKLHVLGCPGSSFWEFPNFLATQKDLIHLISQVEGVHMLNLTMSSVWLKTFSVKEDFACFLDGFVT